MHPIFASHRPGHPFLLHLTSIGRARNVFTKKIQTRRCYPKKSLPDPYHCFLMKERNAGNYVIPEGTERPHLFNSDGHNQMHKRWQAMSPLERSAATDDVYLKKKESALRCHSEQQSQMLAELDNISEEMGGYLDRLKEIKNTPLDEIRSMTWLREDHRLRILNRVWHLRKGGLKPHIQNLIAGKLEEVIGHGPVRMAYKSFDTRITKKYGVIIENWPQLPFASANNTPEDTITLYLLWKSGATRFKRLSPEEKEIWDATREKLQMERNKVTSPNLRSLPSRAFPSHRMLLDTKLLGTIDQISEFMFPSYAPKKCLRPRDNK